MAKKMRHLNKKAIVKCVLIAKPTQDILLETKRRLKHHVPYDPICLKPVEISLSVWHANIPEATEEMSVSCG